jgi:cysteine-rich repeat protein
VTPASTISGTWNWSCNADITTVCAATHIYCGDGILQPSGTDSAGNPYVETCDDGNNSNTDSCTNNCKIQTTIPIDFTFCGDGEVNEPNSHYFIEQCDDKNNIDGDGCDYNCQVEAIIPPEAYWACGPGTGNIYGSTGEVQMSTALCANPINFNPIITSSDNNYYYWTCPGFNLATSTTCKAKKTICGDGTKQTPNANNQREVCDVW